MTTRSTRKGLKATSNKTDTAGRRDNPRGAATRIVRIWSARATVDGAKKYLIHFRQKVSPQLQQIAGYRGALLLRRGENEEIEIQVLTFWNSMASIRQFAGIDLDRAVVEDEARAVLQDFDARVTHFQVVLDTYNSLQI
jgi:heme-degrading monooxygenase HmoA